MDALRKGGSVPALGLRRGAYPSQALGGVVTLRELTRAEYLAAYDVDEDLTTVGADGARYLTPAGVDVRAASVVAAGAIDPETGEALWAAAEVMAWPRRADLWADVAAMARAILELSEALPGSLKSGGAADDAGGST